MKRSTEVWTTKEVADYLRLSERTITNWAQDGTLPGALLGNEWRFNKETVEKWLRRRVEGAADSKAQSKMPIEQALTADRILIRPDITTKAEVLNELAACLGQSPAVEDLATLHEAILKREKIMSTGIALGIAVPHARLDSVSELAMAAASCQEGIQDYASIDNSAVKLVFMVAIPSGAHVRYINLLSDLMKRMKHDGVQEELAQMHSSTAFYDTLIHAAID